MSKNLLIIFVKNIKLGKVKTRLAKTIGNENAFEIYKELVKVTEQATEKLNLDKRVYFSDTIIDSKWQNHTKKVQKGIDLGERMKNAFLEGFEDGYKNIILIGSDLPDISSDVITKGYENLQKNEVVFGPAEDGGYYLLGLSKMIDTIFDNKPWSQSNLLKVTLQELKTTKEKISFLQELNDIDTIEDLLKSDFYKNNIHIQKLTKNDKTTTT